MKNEIKFIKTLMHVSFSALFITGNIVYATTADDVVCSQCVDNSDIANGTITAGKIAPNAVTTGRIAVNAISTLRIQPGAVNAGRIAVDAVVSSRIKDGEVRTQDLRDQAVTEDKLAVDAVTSSIIVDGDVKTADIDDQAVTEDKLDLNLLDKINDSAQFKRIILVNGDLSNTDNGAALLAAVTTANSAALNATADSPILLMLEPGTYDVGLTQVGLDENVSIKGSGQQTTIITGNRQSGSGASTATITVDNNSELSHLTVTNSGGGIDPAGIFNYAVYLEDAGTAYLSHATINAIGPTARSSRGVFVEDNAKLTVIDSTIFAEGIISPYAIYSSNNSYLSISDSKIITSDGLGNLTPTGIFHVSGTVIVSNSYIESERPISLVTSTTSETRDAIVSHNILRTISNGTFSISSTDPDTTLQFSFNNINAATSISNGTQTCMATAFDSTFYADTCP